MTETVRLITAKRDDLFDIARILSGGVAPEFMKDADKPVIVSVRGTLEAGKKILFDGTVQAMLGISDKDNRHYRRLSRLKNFFIRAGDWALNQTFNHTARHETGPLRKRFGDQIVFTGRYGIDEYWKGSVDNEPVELTYIDSMYQWGYSNHSIYKGWTARARANIFMEERERGGITFIQNGLPPQNDVSWIDIYIEKFGEAPFEYRQARHKTAPDSLQQTFRDMGEAGNPKQGIFSSFETDWTRFVTIEVKNSALLDSPQFQQALDELREKGLVYCKPEPENDNFPGRTGQQCQPAGAVL